MRNARATDLKVTRLSLQSALFVASICSLGALAGCGGSSVSPSPAAPMGISVLDADHGDAAVLSHISPMLTVAQQFEIYDVLAAVPDSYRENVIHFDSDGTVYANRPELIPGGVIYRPTGSGNVLTAPDGTTSVFPGDALELDDSAVIGTVPRTAVICGAGGCTGPFHKRETTPGYTFFQSGITIPCSTSRIHYEANNQQTGYIYTGSLSPNGHQLDIGVQLNPPTPDGAPTSVQPFWCEKTLCGSFGGNPHLACDQNITMAFWFAQRSAAAPTLEVLSLTGPMNLTMTHAARYPEWKQVCSGCTVKRVTSLAVCAGCAHQTFIGTYLGVASPLSSVATPTVLWSNVLQGSFARAGRTAPLTSVPWFGTTYVDDPSNGKATGLLLWNPTDPANEAVGINEIGPRLQLQ